MLNLAAATSADWTQRALEDLDAVLLDHAHCEKKAAGMAVRLLFRYPQHDFLQEPLSRLAREELQHFEALLALLARRGVAYQAQEPSPYAKRLLGLARSCERFKLLAEATDDAELARFYGELLACEARHHQLYVDLACTVAPAAEVRERLAALLAQEADLIAKGAPFVRLHG